MFYSMIRVYPVMMWKGGSDVAPGATVSPDSTRYV